jgi:hypothetical protein
MRPIARAAALLLAIAPSASLAAADVELRTANGDRLYGQVISEDNGSITINHIVWTRGGMLQGPLTIQRDHIIENEPADSLPALYAKHAKAAKDNYASQYALAKWCFERGLSDQAFATAQKLYADDPSDEVTQELIKGFGYVLDNGAWIKEADYAKAHGLTAYEGRLLTPDQITARKADLKAALARDEAESHQHQLDSMVLSDTRRLKEAKDKLTELSKEEAEQRAALGGGGGGGGGGRRGGGGGNGNQNGNGNPMQLQTQSQADLESIELDYQNKKAAQKKAIDTDQKELDAAKQAADGNKDDLTKAIADADAAHKAWIDCLPKDDPDVKAYEALQAQKATAADAADKDGKAPAKASAGKAMPTAAGDNN